MDIKEINIIGDFEAGLKCLQNPSLASRFSPPLHRVPQLYSFWKWGALIFAICATFSAVINRIKLFIFRIHVRCKSFLLPSSSVQISSTAHQFFFGDDFDDSDYSTDGENDDDDGCSTAPPHSDDDQDFDESEDDDEKEGFSGDVFRVAGSGIRGLNRFSWSDFSAGKSVVQLWDSFGLGLDFDVDDPYGEDGISVWDLNRDVKVSSGRNIRIPSSSAAVSLSAAMDDGDGVVLRAYDARADGESPAIYAAWKPRQRKVSRR